MNQNMDYLRDPGFFDHKIMEEVPDSSPWSPRRTKRVIAKRYRLRPKGRP